MCPAGCSSPLVPVRPFQVRLNLPRGPTERFWTQRNPEVSGDPVKVERNSFSRTPISVRPKYCHFSMQAIYNYSTPPLHAKSLTILRFLPIARRDSFCFTLATFQAHFATKTSKSLEFWNVTSTLPCLKLPKVCYNATVVLLAPITATVQKKARLWFPQTILCLKSLLQKTLLISSSQKGCWILAVSKSSLFVPTRFHGCLLIAKAVEYGFPILAIHRGVTETVPAWRHRPATSALGF